MPNPYSTFGLSCPSGGSFYICQNNTTEFIGCCTIDPCRDGSGSCPQANLRNASFSADTYDELKPQECTNSSGLSGLWYTCKYDNPPFMGCCASNPCDLKACPATDLVPAKLNSNPGLRDIFIPAPATSSPVTSSAATLPPTAPAASHNSTDSGISASDSSNGLSTGVIAGMSVSIAIFVLVLVASCVFAFKRGSHARQRKERGAATPFLGPPPGGRFTSPISSPPYSPYRGETSPTIPNHADGMSNAKNGQTIKPTLLQANHGTGWYHHLNSVLVHRCRTATHYLLMPAAQ